VSELSNEAEDLLVGLVEHVLKHPSPINLHSAVRSWSRNDGLRLVELIELAEMAEESPDLVREPSESETPTIGNPRYLEILEYMRTLHIGKSAGYSGLDNPDSWANFREAENVGASALLGCMIRLTDKFRRLCNLFKNPANDMVGEPFPRTAIDGASYHLIAICLWEEEQIAAGRNPEDVKSWQRKVEQ
jgi:hypothetical protein